MRKTDFQIAVRQTESGPEVSVYVQPRARQTAIAGMHGRSLKIRVASPPVDGAANSMLREFFARKLGISRSRVLIVSGEKSRLKILRLEGVPADLLWQLLYPP